MSTYVEVIECLFSARCSVQGGADFNASQGVCVLHRSLFYINICLSRLYQGMLVSGKELRGVRCVYSVLLCMLAFLLINTKT